MKSRTRSSSVSSETHDTLYDQYEKVDLESLTDEEVEALLFEEEDTSRSGVWNLPTVSGLSLIVIGMVYLFQEMGMWSGFDVSALAAMLPWMAGVLIILLGFGVLSWRPKRRKKRKKGKARVKETTTKTASATSSASATASKLASEKKVVIEAKIREAIGGKRLHKSRDKVIAGVCGGLAEYFSVDATLVRILFVALAVATSVAPVLIAYVIMAIVFDDPPKLSEEERIRIIRDS